MDLIPGVGAGGIPQFAFLLATARDVSADGTDDAEVLLLRVEGTAPLRLEADLHAVRAAGPGWRRPACA